MSLGQLGNVRFLQRRFNEALNAFEQVRAAFEALGEPRSVSVAWHQIGMVHARAGSFKVAEHAYKESLKLSTALGALAQQAMTLHQLGSLYSAQERLEDAAAFYQQALAIKRKLNNRRDESRSLHDLGLVLHKLRHFNEARESLTASLTLQKPYGHASQSWKTWAALEGVEREDGRPEAAREARRQALQTYRDYRLNRGDPRDDIAQLISSFGRALRTSGPDAARTLLDDLPPAPDEFAPTLRALHAIAAGSRDVALADDPAHHPIVAVELALLFKSLPPRAPEIGWDSSRWPHTRVRSQDQVVPPHLTQAPAPLADLPSPPHTRVRSPDQVAPPHLTPV